MRFNMRGLLVAGSAAFASLLAIDAHAVDGTVVVSGTISNQTCNVTSSSGDNPGSANQILPVSLGTVSPSAVTSGSATPAHFAISYAGCTATSTFLVPYLDGSINPGGVDSANGNLVNEASDASGIQPATGVEIHIDNLDGGTNAVSFWGVNGVIPSGATAGVTKTTQGIPVQQITTTSTSGVFRFQAKYVANASTVTTGPVRAQFTYQMNYQ